MRLNEFTLAQASQIMAKEELEQLYERILERAAYTPVIGRIREVALRSGWSVARTLAAMTFILMVQNEATMQELMNNPRPIYMLNPLPMKPEKP